MKNHIEANTPLISIVMPTYNGQKYIRSSLDSILGQTYEHWELIIINDCSQDDTLSICEEYAKKDSRIRIYSNPINLKIPKSLNTGFSKAHGVFFTWTSDDNIFLPNALKRMAEEMINFPKIGFVFCNQDLIDENGEIIRHSNRKYYAAELAVLPICGACFMYASELAAKIGGYDSDLFCAEDYDYFCRLALSTEVRHIREILYQYRRHTGALSCTKRDLMLENANKIRATYAYAILQKYKPPWIVRQRIYYKLYKYTRENRWAYNACMSNPLNFFRIIKTWLVKVK